MQTLSENFPQGRIRSHGFLHCYPELQVHSLRLYWPLSISIPGGNWLLCPLKKNGHFKVWTLIGSRSWESKGISQKRHFRNNLDCFESHGELLILSGVKRVSSDCDRSSLLLRNACEVFKGEVLWGLQFPSAQFRKEKKIQQEANSTGCFHYWS